MVRQVNTSRVQPQLQASRVSIAWISASFTGQGRHAGPAEDRGVAQRADRPAAGQRVLGEEREAGAEKRTTRESPLGPLRLFHESLPTSVTSYPACADRGAVAVGGRRRR